MNKRNFYVVLLCVIIAAFGFSYAAELRTQNITEQSCPGGNCETIIKEYEYLPIDNDHSEDQTPTVDENAEIVEKTTGIAGDDVETDSNTIYNRSIFMVGNNVTARQLDINGMLFAAGQKVKTTSKQQSIAAAGETVVMDSTTHQEAYLAGLNVELTKNSSVRDLFVAGGTVIIRGVVRGDIFAAGSNIIIDDATILGDLNVGAESIEFRGDSVIHGTMRYDSAAKIQNLDKSKVGGIASYVTPNTTSDILYIIFTGAASVCSMIACISIFIVFLNRISSKQYEKLIINKTVVKDFGIGIVALIVVPCILIMFMGFNFMSLINAILILAFVAALICSVAIASVNLGRFVNNKILKSKDSNSYQVAMLGAITFSLIWLIPVIGSTFNIILIIAGFGYIIGELIHVFVNRNQIASNKKATTKKK